MHQLKLFILLNTLCIGFISGQRVFNENIPPYFSDSSGKYCAFDTWGYHNMPEYLCTCNNLDAAKTTQTHSLWPGGSLGLNLSGAGLNKLGIWDGGRARTSHIEFGNRIIIMDSGGSVSAHTTAVAGNMIAAGVNANVRGMSYATQLKNWNFTNDNAEIIAAAPDLFLSNHSYASTTAWTTIGGQLYWYGDSSLHPTKDWKFGYYDNRSRIWDSVMYVNPYYLMVKASGNDRGSGVAPGTTHFYWNGTAWALSNTTRDTVGPYDCISTFGNAKNILCVGAVGVYPNGMLGNIPTLNFSSWGPTDDGRIKPDLVAASGNILSVGSANDSAYAGLGGTSMSAPNFTGSLLLLQQFNHQLRGSYLYNSTLKALAIHSARRCKINLWGPDYECGWGIPDFAKAASFLRDSTKHKVVETTLQNLDSFEIFVYLNPSDTFKSTLVWTDPKGITAAPAYNDTTLKLVNDLDMRLLNLNDSIIARPFVLNPTQPALPATTGDNFRDNVEQIIQTNVASAWYKVKVKHKGTLQNNLAQKFSLVISGTQTLTALPVILLSFKGNQVFANQINLDWVTAKEVNNDYFEVYHGTQLNQLQAIGKVKGAGNSNTVNPYNYIYKSNTAIIGTQYFQLKQLDYDGKYTWSPIIAVEPNLAALSVEIVPNPFEEEITVFLTSGQPKTQLSLLKLTGEIILIHELENLGQSGFNLNLSFLESGMYLLVLKNTISGEQLTKKIVKL
jgi:hypothetical protein